MSYHSFSLIPLLNDNLLSDRLSDRFTQIDKLFSRITGEKPLSDIPAYNLYQKNKNHLELTITVPGYKSNELEISVLKNKLTISGKNEKKEENINNKIEKWLHKGIEKKDFLMNFDLNHKIKIQDVILENGLLTLKFNYEVPETEKPQKFKINEKSELEIIEHKN